MFQTSRQIVLTEASTSVEMQGKILVCDNLSVSDTLMCQAASAVCKVMRQHTWLEDEGQFMMNVCALIDLSLGQLAKPSQLGQYPVSCVGMLYTVEIG